MGSFFAMIVLWVVTDISAVPKPIPQSQQVDSCALVVRFLEPEEEANENKIATMNRHLARIKKQLDQIRHRVINGGLDDADLTRVRVWVKTSVEYERRFGKHVPNAAELRALTVQMALLVNYDGKAPTIENIENLRNDLDERISANDLTNFWRDNGWLEQLIALYKKQCLMVIRLEEINDALNVIKFSTEM